MRVKRKMSLVLAIILVVALLMPNAVFANEGLISGKDKVKVELVYLQEKAGGDFGFEEVTKIPAMTESKDFYVGIRVKNIANVSEASTGFYGICVGLVFDNTYLKFEPDIIGTMTESKITGQWNPRMDYTGSLMNLADPYQLGSAAPAVSGDTTTVLVDMTSTIQAMETPPPVVNDESFYVAIVKFRVLKVADENGARVLSIAEDASKTHIDFGTDAEVAYSWNTGNPAVFMGNIAELDNSGVDIFPVKEALPVLTATTKVTGTTTYGETVTVSVEGASLDKGTLDASKYGYQWQRSDTSGANWTDITGATNNTYKLAKADVGKQVRCTLTSTDYEVKSDNTYTNSATIAKATLTLITSAFSNVKADSITEGNTAAVDKEVKFSALNGTYWNGLQSGDAVGLTFKVTYPANSAVGTPSLTGSNFTLTNTDAPYYKLADGTSLSVNGQVNAKTVTSLVITTQPKLNYSVKADADAADKSIDLSAIKLTINYNNSTKDENVAYADFTTKGLTASPAHDTAVTAAMDGQQITITHTTTGKNVKTNAMTVAKDDVLTKIEVKTQPTKALSSYEDGAAFDPAGLVLTATWQTAGAVDVTYADGNITFEFADGSALPTNFTLADSGKTIVAVYQGQKANVGTLTVAAKTSVDVTATITGTITKDYDGKTNVVLGDAEIEYTAPTGYTVDASEAVYTYADANVGEDIAITVSGLKFDGVDTKVNVTNAADLKGNITAVKPKITFNDSTLSQYLGSVTEVTATADPASAADGDKLVVEYEVVTQEAKDEVPCDGGEGCTHDDCSYEAAVPEVKEWKTWTDAQAILNAITEPTTINVRAYAPTADTVNYMAGSADDATTGVLKLAKRANRPSVPVTPEEPEHESYISGYSDGTFKPGKLMTRAEAATILAAISESFDSTFAYTTSLTDVADSWAANYIGFASSQGYINGYPDGTYRPEGSLKRAELVVMLANYAGVAPVSLTNAFTDTNGHWAEGYIAAMKLAGHINGYTDGSFKPDQAVTRAEAVTILNAVLGRTPDSALVKAAVSASPFTDVSANDWFFAQVVEASVEHKEADYHG